MMRLLYTAYNFFNREFFKNFRCDFMQHETDLSPKQQKAILSLIEHQDISSAALASGVNRSTVFRWLQDEAFANAYRSARFEVWSHSIAILQRAARTAALTLEEIAQDKTAPVTGRVSACRAILEHAREAIQTENLAADVKELLADYRARRRG